MMLATVSIWAQGVLTNTKWRNEATGDWEIGFFEHFAVYDCKFWSYERTVDKNDKLIVTLRNGDDVVTIKAKAEKDGKRKIQVGKNKPQMYSLITSKYLPDYPIKDDNPHFKDNGFREDDVTRIVGVISNYDSAKADKPVIYFNYPYFDRDLNEIEVKVDPQGRFEVEIPMKVSLMEIALFDQVVILEPGEAYFVSFDNENEQFVFMGKNSRLQNEMLAHDTNIGKDYANCGQSKDSISAEEYIATKRKIEEVFQNRMTNVKQIWEMYPNISERYKKYQLNAERSNAGFILSYQSFNYPDFFSVPKEVMDYLYRLRKECDPELATVGDVPWFTNYYHNMLDNANAPRGIMIWSADEEETRNKWMMTFIDISKNIADSLNMDSTYKSIYISQKLYEIMNDNAHPLPEQALKYADEMITIPALKDKVLKTNEKYKNLRSRELKMNSSTIDTEKLADINDGETLIAKIIEPFRGRFVFLDVWGTWCSPCKEALSKSKELKEALKEYDIVYLYLANNSPEQTWKDVIKQYELTDENSIHYNLPAEQQKAIERFLNVGSFPSYKLFDKEGRLVDATVSPRDISVLKSVLDKFNK